MSSQISLGRRTLREGRMSKLVLIGVVISLIAFFYYFNGWSPPWLKGASNLHGSGADVVHPKKDGDNTHYMGSIILSPKRGDKCWEFGLDNRNGAMWDKGPIDCDVVPPLKTLQDEAKGLAARRLKAIGKAFLPSGR